MKTIALVMQKGGAGKTVIADQLGFSLQARGKKVRVLDLDVQMSSLFPNDDEMEGEPDFQIIDTRGALDVGIELSGEEVGIEDIIGSSDLVLIPALPEKESVEPLRRVVQLCENAGTDYRIVVNQFDRRHIVDNIILDDFNNDYPGKVLKTTLGRSESLKKARLIEQSIEVVDPRSRYANEFGRMLNEVLEVLDGQD